MDIEQIADCNSLNSSKKGLSLRKFGMGIALMLPLRVSVRGVYIISNKQPKTFNYPCVKANPYWGL